MNRFGDIDASNKTLPPVYGYHSEKLVPIEKALEPIIPHIDELPRYIKIAKKHCHFPSEHGLTQDQSAAIYIYTMEWGDTTLYRVLNRALRSENRQALKIWFPYMKLFDTALDKLPTVKEQVWRGVPIDIEYESEDEVILRMGTEFRVKGDPLAQSNSSCIVHLIEIDDNNDQPLAAAMNEMQLTPAASKNKSTSGKSFIFFLYQITSFMMSKDITE
ncbi:unnamed protein product [Rotaria magnacalcarata]|uniref:NAD(P)(+)--arginine ADP-ribosyltransferase n=1 Tax=Rotaria magnacalcarata TaxID=392030 RepID=A0A815JJV3_9BILA|nr:unnamed protein product [Rotaria magnacalcarata]